MKDINYYQAFELMLAVEISPIEFYPDSNEMKCSAQIRRLFRRSTGTMRDYRKNYLWSSFNELQDEFGEADWDGYGADSISEESLSTARNYMECFADVPVLPNVTVDTRGRVCLEWGCVYEEYLLVKFYEKGRLSLFVQKSGEEMPQIQKISNVLEGRACLLMMELK